MMNVQTFIISVLAFEVICCVYIGEANPGENNREIQQRWRRHVKKSDTTGESVKKEKQQSEEESHASTRSQLASFPSYTGNAVSGESEIRNNPESVQNIMENSLSQMRQLNSPLNYAYNYPYQRYPPQPFAPIGAPGYLYGSLNNLPVQPPIGNGQPLYPNALPPNMMEYGIRQPGLMPFGQSSTQLPLVNGPLPSGLANLPQNFVIYGSNFMAPSLLPGDLAAGHFIQSVQQAPILDPLQSVIPYGGRPQIGQFL